MYTIGVVDVDPVCAIDNVGFKEKTFTVFTLFCTSAKLLYESSGWCSSNMDLRESIKVFCKGQHVQRDVNLV